MPTPVRTSADPDRMRSLVEQHLDAVYNLARWLVRDPHDAQDMAHEACVRALRYGGSFRGGDPRAWILAITRNTCFDWLAAKRGARTVEYDEEVAGHQSHDDPKPLHETDPAHLMLRQADGAQLEAALMQLPERLREAIVLRELEDLSYKQIASIIDVPIGTVMSRLARARARLHATLVAMEDNP